MKRGNYILTRTTTDNDYFKEYQNLQPAIKYAQNLNWIYDYKPWYFGVYKMLDIGNDIKMGILIDHIQEDM